LGDNVSEMSTVVGRTPLTIAINLDNMSISDAAAALARAVTEAAAEAQRSHAEVVLQLTVSSDRAEIQTGGLLESLTEQMTPPVDIVSEAGAVLSQRNGQRRAELLSEFGALTGEQIADERSRARNRHALAARWRKEGRLFGVPYQGQTVYPRFQFDDDGELRTVVADVLAHLPVDRMSPWEVALWWTASNGWLRGRRPVDLLDGDGEALVEAATRLAEPSPL
jgi:hypothetical protein